MGRWQGPLGCRGGFPWLRGEDRVPVTPCRHRALPPPQPVVRKQHNSGYKHKANVKAYYSQFEEAVLQSQIEEQIRSRMVSVACLCGAQGMLLVASEWEEGVWPRGWCEGAMGSSAGHAHDGTAWECGSCRHSWL